MLRDYPDKDRADAIIRGITDGVDIRYSGPLRFVSREATNPPDPEFEHHITDNITVEGSKGRIIGPFDGPPFRYFTCSPLFTIPKKWSSKRRLIHHLSYPSRDFGSVNAGIVDLDVSLSSFDKGTKMVMAAGKGCWMCKIDIASAYRCIPVRPEDFHLLGMIWKGKYYFDRCLPFGMCSSCAIFEWFSSAAEWIVKKYGGPLIKWLIHYIDDFFLVTAGKDMADLQLRFLLAVFNKLGIPVAPEKLVGPVQCITFLGIDIDSNRMEVRLPKDKLEVIRKTVNEWLAKTETNKHELQTLIGQLQFASKAVRSGRSFFRRIIETSKSTSSPFEPIGITSSSPLRLDLLWWHRFLDTWNGTSILLPARRQQHLCVIHTDACNDGYGAVLCIGQRQPRWLHGTWTTAQLRCAQRQKRSSMPYLEMLALVIALSTWATLLANTHTSIRSDCQPTVHALQPLSYVSKNTKIMSLIRTLLYMTATHNILLHVTHVAGVDNPLADALSRAQVQEFRRLCPQAHPSPDTPVPLPTHGW